jgi:hypothetical protein
MLEWMIDGFFSVLKSIPPLWTEQGSPNFMLVRAMLGLLLIVLIACVVAMAPVRGAIGTCLKKLGGLFARN